MTCTRCEYVDQMERDVRKAVEGEFTDDLRFMPTG